MTLVLLTWCPDLSKPYPCNICQQQPPATGYPPWNLLWYDGVSEIRFFYQLQVPFVDRPILNGGHTITFGPHSLPDPGMWYQVPVGPPGDVWTFFTVTSVYIGTGEPVVLPSIPFPGPDSASVQAADLAAQWQGYDYAVANPP